jgi:RNA-splicing ligase RtcB
MPQPAVTPDINIFGQHDERTIRQLERCVTASDAARGVLCADGHLGYSMPIGGVVAYREHLSPSGVGFDIGCGNKAVLTNLSLQDVEPTCRGSWTRSSSASASASGATTAAPATTR